MDVPEIRAAFLGSESLIERLRQFRAERLMDINSGNVPVAMLGKARLVVHLMPLTAFDAGLNYDLTPVEQQSDLNRPMGAGGGNHRHNFDGYLTFYLDTLGHSTYALFFRRGLIEAVDADFLGDENGDPCLPSIAYEKEVIQAVQRYSGALAAIGVEPPVLAMISLLGVAGVHMGVGREALLPIGAGRIDREILVIPEVLLDKLPVDGQEAARVLRPVFDSVWNAAGWRKSLNYGDSGEWQPRR